MDRDIQLGNRVIANYMQEKQKKRLKERLKHIKTNKSEYSSQGHIKDKPRTNSQFFQKNQQIEKQNIALFNRIASIVRKTPKIVHQQQTSTSMLQKSRQTATIWHRKLQSSLQEQNKIIQKRLFNQKPTINNKSFYQQRARHLQYLKNISKYPYILNKCVKTEQDNNILDELNINVTELPLIQNSNGSKKKIRESGGDSCVKELFRHQSLDFVIVILMDMKQQLCTFVIQSIQQGQQQKYTLTIPKGQFINNFQQSEYDYEKMISYLRLDDDGKIVYTNTANDNENNNNKRNQSPRNDKQTFKCRAQSTAYTSTGFKCGFRTSKRNITTEKSQKKDRDISKTDRKPQLLKTQSKQSQIKQDDSMSENKFNQGNIFKSNS